MKARLLFATLIAYILGAVGSQDASTIQQPAPFLVMFLFALYINAQFIYGAAMLKGAIRRGMTHAADLCRAKSKLWNADLSLAIAARHSEAEDCARMIEANRDSGADLN
jgi:hypothetical protein